MEEATYALAVAARPALLKYVKDKRLENCCSVYSVVYETGSVIPSNTNCYASLSSMEHYRTPECKGKPLALVLYRSENYSHTLALSDEVRVTYLKWLLNESPWAAAFVDKEAVKVFEERLLTVDTDVDGRVVGAACVGFRRLWEYCQIVQTWYDLTSKGINANLAYYLAHNSNGAVGGDIYWQQYQRGHVNLNYEELSRKGLLNFIKGTPVGANPTYKASGKYKEYSAMFQINGAAIGTWIHDNFPYKDEEPKEEVVNKNPFTLSKPKPIYGAPDKSIAYDKGIERMVEFSKRIMQEIGYE